MTNVPKSHPRYASLTTRHLIEEGVKMGITSLNGLIAQGRGEAFDYIIGEQTQQFAKKAIQAAAAMFLLAKHPVISVNGNTAVLVPKELITLGKLLNAPLEINLFYSSAERIKKIQQHLYAYGATTIFLPERTCTIPYLESERRFVNPKGMYQADVVFVPLEDGDRTEALIKNGKKVITVDLNPFSRTAQKATITIVDNIIRTVPLLTKDVSTLQKKTPDLLEKIIKDFNNKTNLQKACKHITNSFK